MKQVADVTGSPMESTGSSVLAVRRYSLLLVGDNDDFRYLSTLLSQTGGGHLGLDHARSTEEALVRLGQSTYDLLLCEYKPEEGAASAPAARVTPEPSGRTRDLSQRSHG